MIFCQRQSDAALEVNIICLEAGIEYFAESVRSIIHTVASPYKHNLLTTIPALVPIKPVWLKSTLLQAQAPYKHMGAGPGACSYSEATVVRPS